MSSLPRELQILRDYASKGKIPTLVKLSEDNSALLFEKFGSKKDETKKISATKLLKTPFTKEQYTLASFYLFLKHPDPLGHKKACQDAGVSEIKILEREKVGQFFKVKEGSNKAGVGAGASSSASAKKKRKFVGSTQEQVLEALTNVVQTKRLAGVSETTVDQQQQDDDEVKVESLVEQGADLPTTAAVDLVVKKFVFDIPEDDEVLKKDREAVKQITSNEIPVGDSRSVLLARDGRDFQRVLNMFLQFQKEEKSKSKRSLDTKDSKGDLKKKVEGPPIIIVPNAMTSILTQFNAKEFLSEGVYKPSMQLKKEKGGRKENITFKRKTSSKFGNFELEYEVIDNPAVKLGTSKSRWDRVVAVFCQGAEWQFKGWLWSSPVEIFSNAMGFYMYMDGDPVPPEIRQWDVKLGTIHRDKRGFDSVTCAKFFNLLDEYMALRKREYLVEE